MTQKFILCPPGIPTNDNVKGQKLMSDSGISRDVNLLRLYHMVSHAGNYIAKMLTH